MNRDYQGEFSGESNLRPDADEERNVPTGRETPPTRDVQPSHLATSTFLSLVMVLGILLMARLLVPSLVESVRYGWYRGQLRAEYEMSGQQLRSVSLDSLADVSQLVSQRMGPSVVHINVRSAFSDETLELLGGRQFEGQGSGFVISPDGYILTNDHVLTGGGEVEVTLSDGRRISADVIGTDSPTDLAVLKVQASDLLPIEWGRSEDVIVGTPVWAVGSPFGLQQTVTFGIISGKHRVDFRATQGGERVRGTPYGDLMQSDVALNPGNSGGPLVNSLGQVVGVNAAILGETFQGVSFSIPSRVAKQVAEHLIREGSVPRGWLGVALVDLPQDERYTPAGKVRTGVRVSGFPAVSPAKEAGVLIGDVIHSFNDRDITSVSELIRLIGESPVGATIRLGIERKPRVLQPKEDRESDNATGLDSADSSDDARTDAAASERSDSDEEFVRGDETAMTISKSSNKPAPVRVVIEVRLDRRNPKLGN